MLGGKTALAILFGILYLGGCSLYAKSRWNDTNWTYYLDPADKPDLLTPSIEAKDAKNLEGILKQHPELTMVNKTTAYAYAANCGTRDCMRVLQKYGANPSYALSYQNVTPNAAKLMVKQGAKLDYSDPKLTATALENNVDTGNVEMVRWLLENKAAPLPKSTLWEGMVEQLKTKMDDLSQEELTPHKNDEGILIDFRTVLSLLEKAEKAKH
jgi:ankyrin repeat protein